MKIVKHITDFKHNWFKILHSKKISPLAKVLQLTLLSCNPVKYKPKVKDIATQFGESERNMYRAIAQLKSAGYLISYGLYEKCIWHVYDKPTFMSATGGSPDKDMDCQNQSATGGIPLLYNDCGAIKSPPPQSPNEEKKIEDFQIPTGREMTEVERKKLSDSLPF